MHGYRDGVYKTDQGGHECHVAIGTEKREGIVRRCSYQREHWVRLRWREILSCAESAIHAHAAQAGASIERDNRFASAHIKLDEVMRGGVPDPKPRRIGGIQA